jgi:hypothetical protein
MKIEELWRDHVAASMPRGCVGQEIDGIDLMSLDSFTAGCVSTFLERGGKLDSRRLAVLGQCYRDLRYVIPGLEPRSRRYFERLETLAGEVLKAIASASRRGKVR